MVFGYCCRTNEVAAQAETMALCGENSGTINIESTAIGGNRWPNQWQI